MRPATATESAGYRVNPRLTWTKKGEQLAVFLNFDYFFFEGQTADWLLGILEDENKDISGRIPAAFIKHLHDRRLLITE